MRNLAVRLTLLGLVLTITVGGQTKPTIVPADYGQWESLVSLANHGGLSPDGQWLTYGINRSNRNNELRITHIVDGATKIAAFGAEPVFSGDSRWAAYSIGYSETQEDKLRKDKKPVQKKLGVLNLASGQTTEVEGIESFGFAATGSRLAMRRYAPEKPGGREGATDAGSSDDAEQPAGATLIVRDLASGRDTTFGNVAEFAWQDKGRLLAMTISTEQKTGNGVQLFDPESGALRVLDSSASMYAGLVWHKNADELAVLRSKTDDRHDGPTQVAILWSQLSDREPTMRTYDPGADPGFPGGMRLSAFRRPTWSDAGHVLFLGMAAWPDKAVPVKAGRPTDGHDEAGADDELAGVDVWHPRDVDVMPRQKINARTDRRRTFLAAWHVDSGRFVQLGKDAFEQVTPARRQALVTAVSWAPYSMDRSFGRGAADLYLVDVTSGERKRIKEHVDDRYAQVSPAGRYYLYFDADHYWTIDLATGTTVNITKAITTSFANRESDSALKQKPPHGVAGWTKDDQSVILYDAFDLWQVAPDGTRFLRLTDGAADQVRHRLVRIDPEADSIDPAKPVYLSLYGAWTKKSGYARLTLSGAPAGAPAAAATNASASRAAAVGGGAPLKNENHLLWLDKRVDRFARAKDADVFAYVTQAFDDSPDVFVGGPDLKGAKQVTTTNPFQSRFAWGHAGLVDYKSDRGERLQGALMYPAGYEAGKRYPMIVLVYEKRSDLVHQYSSPSERDYYNVAAFTGHGYFVLQPDIVFRPREPGLSVVECVGPAVRRVIQMGLVDPTRVGVVGHSWGGFDTTFLATHSDLFAAAVAGAPITDLVSNYGNHHWSSGIAETDHIETGQQRMEVPLWEDLPAYIRNSALFGVSTMKTPLLIEVGDNDGTVHFHQGVELYNSARRAGKNVVLIVYAGEDHGLRKKPNQIDYHRRIVEWFGHYLKGDPAPAWITDGVPFLERERQLRALQVQKTTSDF
ncbi:MAG: S9 family peptidase [Acidobacteria bacterium]|nr:S9 family peptidase [Acidobacteriota bacterium]